MKKNIVFIIVSFILVVLVSCDYKFIQPDTGEPVDPEVPISFETQVEPIWTSQNCVNCHNGSGLFSLKTGEAYQSLVNKNLLNLDNPEDSKIVTVPGTSAPHNNYNYAGNQKTLIITWIEQGAEDN